MKKLLTKILHIFIGCIIGVGKIIGLIIGVTIIVLAVFLVLSGFYRIINAPLEYFESQTKLNKELIKP